jgi:hypothetical protein
MMRLRRNPRQADQRLMSWFALGAISITIWGLAERSKGQSVPDKNVIHGVVLSGASRRPVEDVIAIAKGVDGRSFGPSEPTTVDGQFKLVVPEDESGFRLDVHDEQVRYLDYYPEAPFANKTHPHDFGNVVIYNPHELSSIEISVQMESASLLHSIGDGSAAKLMDKIAKSYFETRPTDEVVNVHGCPSFPSGMRVAYNIHSSSNSLMLKPVAFAPIQKTSESRKFLSADEIVSSQLSARLISQNMVSLNAAENSYFERNRSYGDSDQLINARLATEQEFLTPAGCIDVLLGNVVAGMFEYLGQKPPYSSYLLVANPAPDLSRHTIGDINDVAPHRETRSHSSNKTVQRESQGFTIPNQPGSFLLISGPDGIVRYGLPGDRLLSINDAKPIAHDFPLGIAIKSNPAEDF